MIYNIIFIVVAIFLFTLSISPDKWFKKFALRKDLKLNSEKEFLKSFRNSYKILALLFAFDGIYKIFFEQSIFKFFLPLTLSITVIYMTVITNKHMVK